MSSFLFGTEYGTDQINVGSDDIGNYINYNNPNNLNQINAIKNKESRLLKKFNQYTPTIKNNTQNNNTRNNSTRNNNTRNNSTRNNNTRNNDDSVYANDGLNLDKLRYDIINDIENKYFAGNEISVKDYIQETNEKRVKNPRKYTGKNIVSEGFNVRLNDLHYELEEMEKKNNMLLVFIFFLVIIIIIQYSKNIDKLQLTAMPALNSPASATNPTVPNA